MANSNLFRSLFGPLIPAADARNRELAPAYARSPEQALAQYAATGCLHSTFYATAEDQLTEVLGLATAVSPQFLARTAIYCRERGHMKDVPALLLAALSRRDPQLMDRVFDRVVDTPRMLRTFVQIVRSGATGRKSLGSAPRRCVRRWLHQRTDATLFAASVGERPSIADIVRLVHPKPATREREALYAYLTGREVPGERLPDVVRHFEDFKAGRRPDVPDVPFQLLTGRRDLSPAVWRDIARRASWQTTRMNLNAFARHGVFADRAITALLAARLRNASEIASARVLPYQVMMAARAAVTGVPAEIHAALEDAMEQAIAHVPAIDGQVFVCPDVSGSMVSPITGQRGGGTTSVRCVDVAALIAAAFLRRNPTSVVLPFNGRVVSHTLSADDTVFANTALLSALVCGGTSVSAPLSRLNGERARGDLIVIVSDNQSWADQRSARGTRAMREWSRFRERNPRARLALLDLQPSATTQAVDREDVLNIGGFSDDVFRVIADFAAGTLRSSHWIGEINAVAH
jgi:60 kDa SS-A/Ro ribonucleoprotein